MALVQQAQKIFDTGAAIPGQIRKAQEEELIIEGRQQQIAGKKEQNRFDKFANAAKQFKTLAPILETMIDKKRLQEDPSSGIDMMDEIRQGNKFIDDMMNNMALQQGEVGPSILKNGQLGIHQTTKITKENFKQKAKETGLPESELEMDIGGMLQTFSGDAQTNQPAILKVIPVPRRSAEETLDIAKGKSDIKLEAAKEKRTQVFLEEGPTNFRKRTLVKEANELGVKFSRIKALLSEARNGNAFVQPTIIKSFINLNEARISDNDYRLQTGNASIPRSVSRLFKLKTKGTFTEQDMRDIENGVDTLLEENQRVLDNEADKFSSSASNSRGIDKKRALDIIRSELDSGLDSSASTPAKQTVRQNLSPQQIQVLEERESSLGGTFPDEIISELLRTGEL